MIIATRKGIHGRRIVRANLKTTSVTLLNYENFNDGPHLTIEMTGPDEVNYRISLNNDDIEAVLRTRQRYRDTGIWS